MTRNQFIAWTVAYGIGEGESIDDIIPVAIRAAEVLAGTRTGVFDEPLDVTPLAVNTIPGYQLPPLLWIENVKRAAQGILKALQQDTDACLGGVNNSEHTIVNDLQQLVNALAVPVNIEKSKGSSETSDG